MSVAIELEAGRWIKKVLEDELDSRISGAFLDIIPDNKKLPAIRYQVQTRNDVREVAQHIVVTTFRFLVVATVQGEVLTELIGLAEDLHDTLHRNQGTTSKARILACTRLEPYGMTEVAGADMFRHAGGIYELVVQSL